MSALIDVRGVGHVFGRGDTAFRALRDVDLTIQRGEIQLLMGPSGSGKTTLIQIIGALLRPSEGSVIFDGEDLCALTEAERRRVRLAEFGFVFQEYNLFPTLSAQENVMVALDLVGMGGRRARERARELLTSVGLSDRLPLKPELLSGGQRQRVAIARALAADPRVLLADEPTAALDSESGQRVLELFRDLAHRQQRAVLIVTHDPRILKYADRVVRIEDGRIADNRAVGEHERH